MRNFTVALISIIFSIQNTSANARSADSTTILECYDGTFSYNTFVIKSIGSRIFVGISGGNLVQPSESFNLLDPTLSGNVKFEAWSGSVNMSILLAFTTEDCSISSDESVVCQASTNNQPDHFSRQIFLARTIRDLDTVQKVITIYNPISIRVTASKINGIELQKIDYVANGGQKAETLGVVLQNNGLKCNAPLPVSEDLIPSRFINYIATH
jgi:hypothetical protein